MSLMNMCVCIIREGVMEFLLANHPLDCPICDQGGECDLQVIQVQRYESYSASLPTKQCK